METKELTGYPSIDKPWLKYYTEKTHDENIPAKSMFRLIYESNEKRLNHVAIQYFDKKITYGCMFENIRKTACAFSNKGIKEGDIVSIISLNTPETVYCIYALNYIGAVANLLLATSTQEEICEQLATTHSKMLLVLDKILEKWIDFQCGIPVVILPLADSAGGCKGALLRLLTKKNKKYELFKQFITIEKRINLNETNSEQARAVIVYTSGSTGVPKGVVLSNRNLNAVAIMCSLTDKNHQPHEKFLNILPPFFSFGIGMLHLCFYTGMTEISALVPKEKSIKKMIKKYRPERFVIGPAFTDVIEKYKGKDLSFLIDLSGGGGAISLEKERKINKILLEKNAGSRYLAGYGMTELASAASMNQMSCWKEQSIGVPLPMINMKVVNDNGEELGYEQEGELLVCSPGGMEEYFNMPKETGETIEIIDGEKWIHTGDLAKIDRDGFVFITGRLKRIYIVTTEENIAYKLFPQRMEEIIENEDFIHKCAVIVIEDAIKGYIPVVFITVERNQDETNLKRRVDDLIKQKLPSYYKPQDIIVLNQMPVNSSQKVDYRKLENMYVNKKFSI